MTHFMGSLLLSETDFKRLRKEINLTRNSNSQYRGQFYYYFVFLWVMFHLLERAQRLVCTIISYIIDTFFLPQPILHATARGLKF